MNPSFDIMTVLIPLATCLIVGSLTWVLVELALLLRDTRHVVEEVQEKVDAASTLLHEVKDRMENSFSVLSALVSFIKSTFGSVEEKKKR